ncbi:MAG: hypothetical protein GF350_16585 [Chitinivibrionales bacterium]|nr:hypothetical protein [Chitinivibrionales bacterium]
MPDYTIILLLATGIITAFTIYWLTSLELDTDTVETILIPIRFSQPPIVNLHAMGLAIATDWFSSVMSPFAAVIAMNFAALAIFIGIFIKISLDWSHDLALSGALLLLVVVSSAFRIVTATLDDNLIPVMLLLVTIFGLSRNKATTTSVSFAGCLFGVAVFFHIELALFLPVGLGCLWARRKLRDALAFGLTSCVMFFLGFLVFQFSYSTIPNTVVTGVANSFAYLESENWFIFAGDFYPTRVIKWLFTACAYFFFNSMPLPPSSLKSLVHGGWDTSTMIAGGMFVVALVAIIWIVFAAFVRSFYVSKKCKIDQLLVLGTFFVFAVFAVCYEFRNPERWINAIPFLLLSFALPIKVPSHRWFWIANNRTILALVSIICVSFLIFAGLHGGLTEHHLKKTEVKCISEHLEPEDCIMLGFRPLSNFFIGYYYSGLVFIAATQAPVSEWHVFENGSIKGLSQFCSFHSNEVKEHIKRKSGRIFIDNDLHISSRVQCSDFFPQPQCATINQLDVCGRVFSVGDIAQLVNAPSPYPVHQDKSAPQ